MNEKESLGRMTTSSPQQKISLTDMVHKTSLERFTATVTLLDEKKFKVVSAAMPRTVEEAARVGVPMRITKDVCSNVLAFIEFELVILMSRINLDARLTFKYAQIPEIAQALYEEFSYESLEDVSLCLRKGATGKYGEIYRLDVAVVCSWMRQYLAEKAAVLEKDREAEKQTYFSGLGSSDPVNPERNLLSLLQTVIGKPQDPTDNREENAYQRFRLEYFENLKKKSQDPQPTQDELQGTEQQND